MGYEKKLARSFSQFEPQKLTFGLLLGCFFVLLTYLSISKPYGSLLSTLNLRLLHSASPVSETIVTENTTLTERKNIDSSSFPGSTIYSNKTKESQMQPNSSSNVAEFDPPPPVQGYSTHVNSTVRDFDLKKEKEKPVCDRSNNRFDLCELEGDVRVHIKQSTVILVTESQRNDSWRIRPYPRKSDSSAMASVSEVALRLSPPQGAPACSRYHSLPAMVFSVGGYSGNFFHDFSDALLPLFQTSREFDGEVVFLVSDFRSWWIRKYLPILTSLSRYPIIGLHDPSDGSVHCFPRAVVGLRTHGNLNLDPSRSRYTMVDFTGFLRKAYALPRDAPISEQELGIRKPRLLIIARNRTRRFTNLESMVRTAAKLGFEVVVSEAGGNVAAFARVVNTCDVMLGVHGAGLTNLVFLPTKAVVIQVVPWGHLDWISRTYFGEPARRMDLSYLEYEIEEEESSLVDNYARDHPVRRDPHSIHGLGWVAMKEVYLEKQDVKLNLRRFGAILVQALDLLRH